MTLLEWLTPWEFSPLLLLSFGVGSWLFWRGVRVHRVGKVRQWLFWTGMVVLYLTMHTHIDYYAERMFFIHRLQHLVLHHLAPLLIMAAYPGQVMRAGLPMVWRVRLMHFRRTRTGAGLERLLTHPVLVPLMFVLLVVGFLHPTTQFYSMLDWRLYRLMNWSVVISGFLYWNLILDRRPSPPAAMSPGGRIISPILTMVPQMITGAIITFTERDIYPIFDLCGRAIPGVTALVDQAIGGLTMWVLAGLVEVFGLLYALATMMRLSAKHRLRDSSRSPQETEREASAPEPAASR